jgi:site-specific DNA-methyltransferase (adenine-specific)
MPEPIQLARNINLYHADCREALRQLADNSIDSVVTDPPYALVSILKRFGADNAAPLVSGSSEFLYSDGRKGASPYKNMSAGFMGKKWDTGDVAHNKVFWAEVLRVLKPGGHIAVFGGTRTYHRVACAIEDGGFEIRDSLMWIYSQGFPKNHRVNRSPMFCQCGGAAHSDDDDISRERCFPLCQMCGKPNADGYGSSLKPAFEPIVLARKPLSEGTVPANVLKWGTGAINVDGCRIPTSDKLGGGCEKADSVANEGWRWMDDPEQREVFAAKARASIAKAETLGRWPANVCHDGSDEVVGMFPQSASGGGNKNVSNRDNGRTIGNGLGKGNGLGIGGDSGSAARFFYSAKASRADRAGSKHPTVKPIALMQWLARLITPPSGTILDPFAGSGTAGIAAQCEGFACIMCEREDEYAEDIRRRFTAVQTCNNQESRPNQNDLFDGLAADA